MVLELMEMLGLEKERFRLVWCSSAEAERFVQTVREMTDAVRALGPSPYRAEAPERPDQEVAACQ